jgi:hypothetical protein
MTPFVSAASSKNLRTTFGSVMIQTRLGRPENMSISMRSMISLPVEMLYEWRFEQGSPK